MIQNTKKVRHKAGDPVKQEPRIQNDPISVPEPGRYVPPEHSACMGLRPDQTKRYGIVYKTESTNMAITRYCKCRFCGVTYKDVQIIR